MKPSLLASSAIVATALFDLNSGFVQVAEAQRNPDPCAILGTTHCTVAQGVIWTPAQWTATFQSFTDVISGRMEAGTVGAGTIMTFGNFATLQVGGVPVLSSFTAGAGLFVNAGTVGGSVGNSGTINAGQFFNAQVGTTYAVVNADLGLRTTFNNAAAVAVSLPQAGAASSFLAGWKATYENLGAGLVTITPATSTINGQATLILQKGQFAEINSDGTNYAASVGSPLYVLAGNALSTRIPDNGTLGGNVRGAGAVDLQPYGVSGQSATAVASGPQATAVGSRVTSSGTQATAVGYLASATGTTDTALGGNAGASGGGATAVGQQATAAGSGVAVGNQSNAAGLANAIGFAANAVGTNSNAIGRSTNVAGSNSSTVGNSNSLTATTESFAMGANLSDRGNIGAWITGVNGRNFQDERYVFVNTATVATARRLTTDNAAAGGSNIASLGNNSAMVFTAECAILDTTTAQVITYSQGLSLITRGTAAATTAISSGNPTMVAGPTTASPFTLAVAPALTADTTNGGINISYTPPVANTDTLHASCRIRPLYQF